MDLTTKNILTCNPHTSGSGFSHFDNKLISGIRRKTIMTTTTPPEFCPAFAPDSKLRLLRKQFRDQAEIVIVISAGDIEKNKIRGDLGITYDSDVIPSDGQPIPRDSVSTWAASSSRSSPARASAVLFKSRLARLGNSGVKVYIHHYMIPGYPSAIVRMNRQRRRLRKERLYRNHAAVGCHYGSRPRQRQNGDLPVAALS